MKDMVSIIIQGYSTSKNQLKNIYDNYRSSGFNNIIISSYSESIPDEFLLENFVINNDDILGKYDRVDYRNATGLNYQIITTNRAIQLVQSHQLYKHTKYILKLRGDQELKNISKFVESWTSELEKIEDRKKSPFKKKIITMGMMSDWYITDFLNFGLKEDMFKLWNIPISFSDNCRAENYINTFYLIKFFGGNDPHLSNLQEIISNDYVSKYNLNPSDYFLFDKRTHADLYSHKLKLYFNTYNDMSIYCHDNIFHNF